MDIFFDNNKIIKNTAKTIDCKNTNNKILKEEKEKLLQSLMKRVFENLQDTCQCEVTYVVDRFEEKYAVCENRETKEMINIEMSKLPSNIEEGDVLTYRDNAFFINADLKQEIEERIHDKVKNIFED